MPPTSPLPPAALDTLSDEQVIVPTDAELFAGIHSALDRIQDNYRRAFDFNPHWLTGERDGAEAVR